MNRWAPITSVKIRILVIALTLPWAITCSAQYRDRPAEPDACDAKLRDTMVLRISTPKDYGKVKGTSQAVTGEIVDYFDNGGNIIVIGDIDTSLYYKKLFYALGVDL